MVDEREDRYDGEEGEYHFSDDQVNYDELDAPKAPSATVPVKKSLFDRFSTLSPSRRLILAGIVFVSLIFIVYKMLLPSQATSTAEISPVIAAKPPTSPVITKPVEETPKEPMPPQQTAIVQPALPVTNPAVLPEQAPQNPAMQPAMTNPPPMAAPQTEAMAPPVQMPPQQNINMPQQTATMPPPPVAQNVQDRVKAVEDHNTAIMNLLQTEYAQKMSELEMQSNLVRGKMDEMAKRINRIEASLNQITQLLQQNAPSANKQAAMMDATPALPMRSAVPRVTYTVQAIIPGRAWLKADTGDTVTVAEGDTLRDYGRITKIDPYDGVVEIDTGNKIIALSYGMSAE